MAGRLIDAKDIDEDCYKIRPPRWVLCAYGFIFVTIYCGLIYLPVGNVSLKWSIIAIATVILVGIFRAIIKDNYLVTLIADRRGLYFQTGIAGRYYSVPWAHVVIIEKVMFPLNSRGLRVEVKCECVDDDIKVVGNYFKESGRCFIYTIPQLLDRDKLIEKFGQMKRSSIGA